MSLGCSRNDVDSEELAGRLVADGWQVTDEGPSDVILVNTCGFIQQAKQDSINTLLEALDLKDAGQTAKVVAVGCMAQRYGQELADELPEADAILGFDDYADIGPKLRDVVAGRRLPAPAAGDRRTLLPIAPVDRPAAAPAPVYRSRLDGKPWAPLKIASGCDRRCTFCAIPTFRGAFVSRDPREVINEATFLVQGGVRELLLVSENSTSYGKDLGDIRLLEKMLRGLAEISDLLWVRPSYLQPAEMRPDLVRVIAETPGVAPYFDLSFQHASPGVLRRMKRFGGSDQFLELLASARAINPLVGARTNVIVGFPGETEDDVSILADFISQARLDAIGVFPYSDEDGTAAMALDGHLSQAEIEDRFAFISTLVERVTLEAAASRVGQHVTVLIEEDDNVGRSAHQAPDVDGQTVVYADRELQIGEVVSAVVTGTDGVDLVADIVGMQEQH